MSLKGLGMVPEQQVQRPQQPQQIQSSPITLKTLWDNRPTLKEFVSKDIPTSIGTFFKGAGKAVGDLAIGAANLVLNNPLASPVGILGIEPTITKRAKQEASEWLTSFQKELKPTTEELPGYIATNIATIAIGNMALQTQLTRVPKFATLAARFPKTFNAISFGTIGVGRGQLTVDLETENNILARAKTAAKDFVSWTAWGAIGGTPAKAIHKYFPGYFTVGYLSSKMEGADNEEAMSAGILSAAFGSTMKLMAVPKQTTDILRNNAEGVFKKYGAKEFTDNSWKKLAIQHHPDKLGGSEQSMTEINTAWNVLSKSPKQIEKSIMNEFRDMWRTMTHKAVPDDRALIELFHTPVDVPSNITPRPTITMEKAPRPITIKELNRHVADTVSKEGLLDTKISELTRQEIKDLNVRETASKIRNINIDTLPKQYQDQIKEIADGFDLKFRMNKTLVKRESLNNFIDKMKLEGIENQVPPDLIDLATRIPLNEMTPNQLITVGNEVLKLVNQAKLKNRLIQVAGKRKIDEVVKDISVHLTGGEVAGVEKPITPRDFELRFFPKFKEKLTGFTQRSDRLERTFTKLDNYEPDGLMWKTFYNPINTAEGQKITIEGLAKDSLNSFLEGKDTSVKELITKKDQINDGLLLTPVEKIGVYMHSLNPDNLYHLMIGNKYGLQDVSDVLNKLTPEEKSVGDWLLNFYKQNGIEINKIKELVDGVPMEFVENYSPIKMEWRAEPVKSYDESLGLEGMMRMNTKWASGRIQKGFLKPRSGEARQPIKINALEIFLDHINKTSHYRAYAPTIRDLQRISKDPRFIDSYIQKEGKIGYEVLDTWLKDVADSDPYRVTNHGERLMRQIRVNAVAAGLGINITTALKQFPSWLTGMAEIGNIPAWKGLYSYLTHSKDTISEIRKYSPTIWKRTMEREVAETKLLKSLDKRLTDRLSPKEALMFLTTTMDRTVVNSLWKGEFDNYLRLNPGKYEDAAISAEKAIRKTQPFFSQKDLAEYWRSGEVMKTLTQFTNQLNNYWNYYRYDTWGAYKAGKETFGKTAQRIIEGFVLPALLIGWISRSKPAQDYKEATKDMAAQVARTIPLMGNYISAGLEGWRPSAPIMFQAFDGLQTATSQIARQDWDKALGTSVDALGFLIGVPVKKIKTYLSGMDDLFTGKTDDWARLIYSEWVRDKAIGQRKKELQKSAPLRGLGL